MFKYLYERGVRPYPRKDCIEPLHSPDSHIHLPLIQEACWQGNEAIFLYLLELGTPVDHACLIAAVRGGNENIVKRLIREGIPPTNCVAAAVEWEHFALARTLIIDYSADVNERSFVEADVLDGSIFGERIYGDDWPIVHRNSMAIVSAVLSEDGDFFHLLMKRGAVLNTEESGGKAVKHAKSHGLDSMMALLKEYGCPYIETNDSRGLSNRVSFNHRGCRDKYPDEPPCCPNHFCRWKDTGLEFQ